MQQLHARGHENDDDQHGQHEHRDRDHHANRRATARLDDLGFASFAQSVGLCREDLPDGHTLAVRGAKLANERTELGYAVASVQTLEGILERAPPTQAQLRDDTTQLVRGNAVAGRGQYRAHSARQRR